MLAAVLASLRAWKERFVGRKLLSSIISCSDAGIHQCLRFEDGEELQKALVWDEIEEVYAYKRDVFAYDLICIAIVDKTNHIAMEVTEDDKGYRDFIDCLPQYLNGCLSHDEWFWDVVLPAFETNMKYLFRR